MAADVYFHRRNANEAEQAAADGNRMVILSRRAENGRSFGDSRQLDRE